MRDRKALRDRRGIVLVAQRAVLRTGGGPLRFLWAAVYELGARVLSVFLRIGRRDAAVYLRGSLGSGEPLYGPADIDLAVVTPNLARPGETRRRAHARWRWLVKRLPWIASLVQLKVYEVDELRSAAAVTALTEHHGPESERLLADEAGLRIRPGLAGPTADWRRIGGPELRPGSTRVPRHLVAWAELQWWWRLCLDACRDPERLHVPYLTLKLITQSVRVRLWLERGDLLSGHAAVLERALETMPDEEAALRRAARLRRELPRSPDPPLADAIGFLLRTAARTADLLREEFADEGTEVALLGTGAPCELALTEGMRSSLDELERSFPVRLLPLADWRARTPTPLWARGRVDPLLADEGLALVDADPADPAQLDALAMISRSGLRPAVNQGPVLLLPSASYFDWVHRAIQFRCSDPVSFALLGGSTSAFFPALSGWSASDCAARAVHAHALWLRLYPDLEPGRTGVALGLLLGAARAALFQQSLAGNQPELALTVGAAADRLAAEQPSAAELLQDASEAYRAWREHGIAPDAGNVIAVRRLIEGLPAYEAQPRAIPVPVAAGTGMGGP